MLRIINNFSEQARNYNRDLIDMFVSSGYKSSFAYLSALILFSAIMYDFVPLTLLLPWISFHLIYLLLRIYLIKHYKDKQLSLSEKERFFKIHEMLLFSGGVAWGIGSLLCVEYAPSPFEYLVFAISIALTAGSISTLSPVYRLYVLFNLPILSFLIAAFMYKGDELSVYITIVVAIFTYVVMTVSWNMHKNLKRFVELKELHSQTQKELSIINTSLGTRIAKEVENNRRKDQKMIEQSRLAQMGEMISMIAHQWRQPLSAITATTSSMRVRMELGKETPENTQESIDKINDYAQHLSGTINDFRNFFKPNRSREKTSLNAVVNESLSIIGSSLQSVGIMIETFFDAKEEFFSYPNELNQVVLNLLKNAKDAFENNTVVSAKIVIKTEVLEGDLLLEIIDNAGGISEEIMEHLFDPYFTTKEKDGTGLGLYMSKMIIEEHCHGELKVKNQDGGACFTLILPRNSESA